MLFHSLNYISELRKIASLLFTFYVKYIYQKFH